MIKAAFSAESKLPEIWHQQTLLHPGTVTRDPFWCHQYCHKEECFYKILWALTNSSSLKWDLDMCTCASVPDTCGSYQIKAFTGISTAIMRELQWLCTKCMRLSSQNKNLTNIFTAMTPELKTRSHARCSSSFLLEVKSLPDSWSSQSWLTCRTEIGLCQVCWRICMRQHIEAISSLKDMGGIRQSQGDSHSCETKTMVPALEKDRLWIYCIGTTTLSSRVSVVSESALENQGYLLMHDKAVVADFLFVVWAEGFCACWVFIIFITPMWLDRMSSPFFLLLALPSKPCTLVFNSTSTGMFFKHTQYLRHWSP